MRREFQREGAAMEKALTTLVRSLLMNSGDRRLASQEGVRWGERKGSGYGGLCEEFELNPLWAPDD